MELVPFLKLAVEVGDAIDLGSCGGVIRRLVPITGGTVSGSHRGVILNGGGDWQQVTPAGHLEIAARYVLSLEEGLVELESTGLRHAPPGIAERLNRGEPVDRDAYYFRTAMRFRTSSPALAYLNTLIGISAGERLKNCVNLDVHRLT